MADLERAMALYGGERRHRLDLPRLSLTYAWMPPFEGASKTPADRLEVVFSSHRHVAIEQAGRVYDLEVAAGAFFVVGSEPTTLLKVSEFSDTLEIYPHPSLLGAVSQEIGRTRAELPPTLSAERRRTLRADPVMLGFAHLLRRACIGASTPSAMEASWLEHRLMHHVLGEGLPSRRQPGLLGRRALERVTERICCELAEPLTLDILAKEAGLSPFHFARSFKRTVGLAPHRYVSARRLDRAKEALMTTRRSVEDIATSLGFENLGHFRRQFRAQFGVLPGSLRNAAS